MTLKASMAVQKMQTATLLNREDITGPISCSLCSRVLDTVLDSDRCGGFRICVTRVEEVSHILGRKWKT